MLEIVNHFTDSALQDIVGQEDDERVFAYEMLGQLHRVRDALRFALIDV